jgi:hypothetical protein
MSPQGDLFAHTAAYHSKDWIFSQHDPQTVSNIVGLCPDKHLESLRTLLESISDPDIALT